MSLNGLDSLDVKEAHDAAIAEPGGWFLLKYATRDEVEVFGRGSGGILEIRNAIAKFDEDAPLFGFLRYRRRNVIIKYVPEDVSRIVQARVTVHITAVTERFAPYDTVFSIGTAKELKDSKLSAACSLHTASGSATSSTSSLRRRRLMEIAEDEEEDKRQSVVLEERAATIRGSSVNGSLDDSLLEASDSEVPELLTSRTYQPFDSEPANDHSTEADLISLSLVPTSSAELSINSSIDYDLARASTDLGRPSLNESRPELNSYHSYPSSGRPKVKLGPRPSTDTVGRPQSPGSTNYRPVSNLPAGLKLFSRSSKRPTERPQSQLPSTTPSMTLSPPASGDSLEVPEGDLHALLQSTDNRPTSSSGASFKSTTSVSTMTSKVPAITPEKARLMKALEMRKKKMQVPQPALLVPLPPDICDSSATSEDSADTSTLDENTTNKSGDDSDEASRILLESSPTSIGIAESDITTGSSMPVSSLMASEPAESKLASSVFESTDEAVLDSGASSKTTTLPATNFDFQQNTDKDHGAPELVCPEVDNAKKLAMPSQATDHDNVAAMVDIEDDAVPAFKTQETTRETPTHQAQEDDALTIGASQVSDVNAKGSAAKLPAKGVFIEPFDDATNKSIEDAEGLDEPTTPIMASPPRELKIPRSKFSLENSKQNGKPTAEVASVSSEPNENGVEMTTSSKKRRSPLEPIRTDLHLNQKCRTSTEADILDDEDLMDELQSATVQEAKPMSMAKSPMKALFPRDVKQGSSVTDRVSRAISNPLKKDDQHLSPQRPEPSRSVSASAYVNRINQQQQAAPLAKKVNLGSGISQRIKALEKLSSSSAGAGSQPVAGTNPGPTSTFFTVRKSNAGSSKAPSIAERANSLTRHTPPPTASRDSSPEQHKNLDRGFSIKNRKDVFNSSPTNSPSQDRRESVSVTARIIRDPVQSFPSKPAVGNDPFDYTPLDLKQSPLMINHQKAIPTPVPQGTKDTIQERRLSNSTKEAKKERRSSINVVKDLITETRNSFAERRKSITIEPGILSNAISSMKSPSRPPSTHQNSSSALSTSSRRSSRDYSSILSPTSTLALSPSTSDENNEKKGSRASRMLHRMSSSFSSSRKNVGHAVSPTVREESEPPSAVDSASPSYFSGTSGSTTTVVEMGDVNVQFPDNLLWKRRALRLDSQGFLILTQSQLGKTTEKSAGAKKYHLSEFRTPMLPDMDMEELPNSVLLDFIDGSGLQFACEDRAGQVWVLQKLQGAHSQWVGHSQ